MNRSFVMSLTCKFSGERSIVTISECQDPKKIVYGLLSRNCFLSFLFTFTSKTKSKSIVTSTKSFLNVYCAFSQCRKDEKKTTNIPNAPGGSGTRTWRRRRTIRTKCNTVSTRRKWKISSSKH
ncbi:unnamed protein product [Amoebophrya sp. A25]|nr:unnamed protein product [Amoebophrya sp. A25]|eukprot:GSA25T00000279001.1